MAKDDFNFTIKFQLCRSQLKSNDLSVVICVVVNSLARILRLKILSYPV